MGAGGVPWAWIVAWAVVGGALPVRLSPALGWNQNDSCTFALPAAVATVDATLQGGA